MSRPPTVAVHCNVQHESLYRLLLEHQAVIEEAFGTVRFQIGLYGTANGGGGKAPSFALLTEQQATVLITFTRNTTPVIKFKVALPDDEKITLDNSEGNPRVGIPRQLACVTEPGLYRLIFRSNKPKAEDFRRWVFHEVLPAIRKTGAYLHGVADAAANPAVDELFSLVERLEKGGVSHDVAATVASDMVRSRSIFHVRKIPLLCKGIFPERGKDASRPPVEQFGKVSVRRRA